MDVLKSRALRLLLWAVAALLLSWAVAWLAVPPLLKWQLQTRGSQLLGRELRVGEVKFVPPTLTLTLTELSVGAAPGSTDATPQLQVARLFIDLDMRSLLRLAPVVAALEIDAPRLRLARVAAGHYDIDDLLQRLAARPPPDPEAEPARFALFNLRLADGEVTLDDQPVQRKHVLHKLRLDLPFLSNLPDDLLIKVEPRLAFDFNGSAFDNHGRSTPFAQGRASEFEIRFDKLDLRPMWAYLPATLPLRASGGSLSADLKLRFEQPQGSEPRVELSGPLELRELSLMPPGDAPLLAWQSLRVQLADVRPLQRRVALDSVQLDGAVLHVRREADGRLELQRLAAAMADTAPAAASAPALASAPASTPSAAAASAAAGPAGGAAWQLQLGELQLQDATVHWQDASLQPAAELQLDGIALQLKQLQWPGADPARLQVDARVLAQGKVHGQLHADGHVSDRQAAITAKLSDIDLALAEPYLKRVLNAQAGARLHAEAKLDWARGETPRLAVALPLLRIDDFKLIETAAAGRGAPAVQLARLELGDVQADLLQRRIGIGTLSLQRPAVELSRDAAGVLSASRWLQAAPAAADGAAGAGQAGADPAVSPPWQLALHEFKLDDGRLRLADAALPDSVLQLSGLRVAAQGLVWPEPKPVATQLSATLAVARKAGDAAAEPSRLDWRGRVSAAPLGASGQVRLERFPVHVFEPYFGAGMPVRLQRLEAGFQGQVDFQQLAQGPSARLHGDALLADLHVRARNTLPLPQPASAGAAPDELLNWNALHLNRLDLTLQPGARPRVVIGELRLADFFSRLEITEEGRFNLQTLGAAPTPQPAAAPAPAAASAAADGSVLSRLPIELLVEGMQFSNGHVIFNDRFVRPNYRAGLSELNGRIGRLDSRSRDMAELEFSGRVAGTGTLQLAGALNPTVIPPALDIKAKAADVELPGLTPYSSKYAGYPIERGKLSMEVAYKVDADGKLAANNKIVVHQLSFGPRSDSPDATQLPVPLLVALLQDKHGVIDLDLPLTGSINDPQFSLGALIWKVIVNLFTKIASSPFAALGGGGKDLSQIDFRPGTAQLAEGSQDALAKVAKALDDRPGLTLGIVAMADPVGEADAMRRARFEQRLLDEQRRERARGALGSSAAEAPLPPLSAEQRERLVQQLYADTRLPDKPRNLIGMAKDIPAAEMEALLLAATPVDDAAARQLAQQRGGAVRDALRAKGLAGERIFLGEPKLHDAAADNAPWVPQARLTLSAN